MRALFVIGLFLLAAFHGNAQTPGIKWEIRDFRYADGINYATADSGVITATSFISKLDKHGLVQWQISPDTTHWAWYSHIIPTSDGNFFAVGAESISEHIRVTKFSASGVVLWENDFGGSRSEFTNSILATGDGGCVIAAETYSRDGDVSPSLNNADTSYTSCWIIKISSSGQLTWQKTLGGSGEDRAKCVIENGSGGFLIGCVAGGTDGDFPSTTEYNTWLLNYDSNGNEIWRKGFDGIEVSDIIWSADNNMLMLANDNNRPGNHGIIDTWVGKIDWAGNILWEKSFGGSNMEYPSDGKIHKSEDGNYLILSQSLSNDGDVLLNNGERDLWLIKINESGSLIWQKTIGAAGKESGMLKVQSDRSLILLVSTTSADGIFSGGYNTSSFSQTTDWWLIKMKENGDEEWKKLIEGPYHDLDFIDYYFGTLVQPAIDQVYVSGLAIDIANGEGGDFYFWLKKIGPANLIKSRAYLDMNGNGIKEPSERWTSEPMITVTGSGKTYESRATSNGMYYTDVDTGSYVISISPTTYYTPAISSQNTSFSSYFNTDSLTFALQPIPNKQDLSVHIIPINVPRPGFSSSYRVLYKNEGTTTISSGEILFKKDTRTNFLSASPSVNSTNGDTLKWSYANFAPGDTASVLVNLQVSPPPTVNNNDTLSFKAIITPVVGDETPSNDTAVLRQRVVGSFDPNDKAESNAGVVSSSFIANGSYLQYTVRFQNTGTAEAFFVVVRDTLGSRVDLSTLEIVAASHPYTFSIENGNQLTWRFDDIMLPDSTTNEPGSHGYIVYRIRPKGDVVAGETIHNTASIYFDYNLPVLTNDATTLVQDNFSALPIRLLNFSGNLNNNMVQLRWETSHAGNFERFDVERSIDGRHYTKINSVLFHNSISKYTLQDDVSAVQSNLIMYRLKLVDADGRFTFSRVLPFTQKINESNFIVYPNPANKEVFISLKAVKNERVQIRIADISGKILIDRQKEVQEGTTVFPVNISNLKAGQYVIQIVTEGKTRASRFTVIN